MSFTIVDVYWAAGFIDGDGTIGLVGKSPRVGAVQVEMFPLRKLMDLWGGTLSPHTPQGYGKKPYHAWALGGPVAVGLMQMLYDLVSPPRKRQIERVLAQWKCNGDKSGERFYNAVLSDEEALQAMQRVLNGERLTKVAERVGISHATLITWLQGKTRPYLLQRLQNADASIPSGAWAHDDPIYTQGKCASTVMCRLHWTAGFLEAEGWIGDVGGQLRLVGTQVELEPLRKLQQWWGGAIYTRDTPSRRNAISDWHVGGSQAAALMMTLYPLMSPSRQGQIRRALGQWRQRGTGRGQSHPGAMTTLSDDDALVAMCHVRDGRSMELVAEHVGVSRHVLSMWMRGRNRPYLLERLLAQNKPMRWRYNGGRRVPSQVSDDVALQAMRRVEAGEPKGYVARELDIKPILITDWLSGKNRPSLLARLQQEETVAVARDVS